MSSNTQGIQQLLAAEKRATDKVSAARRRKAKRLKQARDEAEEEIEVFRKEFESKYKEFLKQNAGSTEDVEANMEKDAQRKISEINQAAKSEYEEVIKGIFLLIQDIKPIIHQNILNQMEKKQKQQQSED